jgi:ABC-type transport system involved in cytochrome bd biosynthesis fused ATPase/permease subunit
MALTPQSEKTATMLPKAGDVVIAVMGTTGTGKSSFISLLSDDHIKIGHSLVSGGHLQFLYCVQR